MALLTPPPLLPPLVQGLKIAVRLLEQSWLLEDIDGFCQMIKDHWEDLTFWEVLTFGSLHLQDPRQEYKWRLTYHMSKYLKHINKTKTSIKCVTLLFCH